jgi:hypothetical protein
MGSAHRPHCQGTTAIEGLDPRSFRFQGVGPDNISRFNMPLELGLAPPLRCQGKASGAPHKLAALVPAGFVHQKFISDLAGFDPPPHERTLPASYGQLPGG